MYIDLTKEKVSASIKVEDVSSGNSVSISDGGTPSVFTFGTNVAIALEDPTYSTGTIFCFNNNTPIESNFALVSASQKLGVYFSAYGVGKALYFNNNALTGQTLSFSISGNDVTVLFGGTEDNSVNVGSTISMTLANLRKYLNNIISNYGYICRVYDSTLVLSKFRTDQFTPAKNAQGSILISSPQVSGNLVTFYGQTFIFGTDVLVGATADICASNLSDAINERGTCRCCAVGEMVYLYSTRIGTLGNGSVTTNSATITCTAFSGGTNTECLITTLPNSCSEVLVSSANINSAERSMAGFSAALTSLSSSYSATPSMIEEKYGSVVTSTIAGTSYDCYFIGYGSNIECSDIVGGSTGNVDKEQTAINLSTAINAQFTEQTTVSSNVVSFEWDNVILSSDVDTDILTLTKWRDGTLDNAMSWQEFINYSGDADRGSVVSGYSRGYVTLEAIFVKGSLVGKASLQLEDIDSLSLTINTLSKISVGNGFSFWVTQCNQPVINVAGQFENSDTSGLDGRLLQVSQCYEASIKVNNSEYSMKGSASYFIKMISCTLNSTLSVTHSTHSVSDSVTGIPTFYQISGNVKATSKANVYACPSGTQCYMFEIGAYCTLTSTNDVGSGDLDVAVDNRYTGAPVLADEVIIDRSNASPWSLNLLCSESNPAFRIYNSSSDGYDIFGNQRGFSKKYGTINVPILGTDASSFSSDMYLEIGSHRHYFGTDNLSLYYSSKEELIEAICNVFNGYSGFKVFKGLSNTFNIVGEYQEVSSNSSVIGTTTFTFAEGGNINSVDAGSRQKHTVLNTSKYVSLSSSVDGDGTEEYPYTVTQMLSDIQSLYPVFGKVTYVLSGTNSTTCNIDFSTLQSEFGDYVFGFADIVFSSKKLNRLNVPTLNANIISGGEGYLNQVLDSVILSGSVVGDTTIDSTNEFRSINSVCKLTEFSGNKSELRIIQSTLVCPSSITSEGRNYFSGNVMEVNNAVVLNNSSSNAIRFRYNYCVTPGASIIAYNVDTEGTTFGNAQCLTDPTASPAVVANFKLLPNSPAISFIPSSDVLEDEYVTNYDIVFAMRSSTSEKVSLDAGAYEENTVLPDTITYYVNLTDDYVYETGKYNPISLQQAYDKILAMELINAPIKIVLYGYGSDLPSIELNTEFGESGSITFTGEPNATMDGFIDSIPFVFGSNNAKIVMSRVIVRHDGILVQLNDAQESSFVMTSDVLLNTAVSNAIKSIGWNVSAFGVTVIGSNGSHFIENTGDTDIVGCLVARNGSTDNANVLTGSIVGFYNAIDSGSMDSAIVYSGLIDQSVLTKEVLEVSDFAITNDTAKATVISTGITEAIYEYGIENGWDEDIKGNFRFYTTLADPGASDSQAVSHSGSFKDKPNGQYAQITEEGSSLITRMFTGGKCFFKICGYSIGKGGYDIINPVKSIPIVFDGKNAQWELVIGSNVFEVGDSIVIGTTELNYPNDFSYDSQVSGTTKNIADAINKSSGIVCATSDGATVTITNILPGVNGNSLSITLSDSFSEKAVLTKTVDGEDSTYEIDRALPSDGYRTFEAIEYLPMAIALFFRVERNEWSGSTGEVIVYAKITKSENEHELNSIIPFAVVRHGLVTKDLDTILVKRVVIQI